MVTTNEQTGLSHRDLIGGFEQCTLPAFRHPEHVRVTWLYLHEMPVEACLGRLREGVKRFAAAKGVDGLYHETITWAFILIIHDRMQGVEDGVIETWEAFVARNPDLLGYRPSILDRFYRKETLASPRAKASFVWPDLLA